MTFRDKEMYWLANCHLIQARILKSLKKKVIKVVGKFDTKYSREKEMVLKCLLWEFVISDLLKWLVLKRWNKKPSTLG